MLLANALKVVCDLLLYFSFASLFTIFRGAWLLMGVVLVLAFVATIFVQKANNSMPARILGGLLPVAGLYAARNLSDILIASVAIAFYAIMTFTDKNDIHYEEYKFWFGIPAVPALVLFVVCFSEWPIRPEATVLSGLYLFFGVFVLRSKRVGNGAKFKHRLMNFAELFALLVLGIVASLTVFEIVIHSSKVVYAIMMPVGALFFAVVSFVSWAFEQVTEPDPDEKIFHPDTPDVQQIEKQDAVEEVSKVADRLNYDVIEIVIAALLILLAFVLLVLFFRWFYKTIRKLNSKASSYNLEIEEGETEETSRWGLRKKKKRVHTLSNNAKIREIYKDYMFFVRTFGVKIVDQTTTEDILTASDELTTPGKAERLRELYIHARYHDGEEMSDAEVMEAQTLLEDIKEQIVPYMKGEKQS